IIGGSTMIHKLTALTDWPFILWCSRQLKHAVWNGFTFYDMIFPLFLFLAGATVPISFQKRLSRGASKTDLYKHLLSRVIILIILGLLYNKLLDFHWETMRYANVLARIGLGWGFAAI